jgi:hypothetical protein
LKGAIEATVKQLARRREPVTIPPFASAQICTIVLRARPAYLRASADKSPIAFRGRPPGFPDFPFWKPPFRSD